jgi:hydrogenase nickel incorporation protein HypB
MTNNNVIAPPAAAPHVRRRTGQTHVFTLSVCGSPGVGKTTLLEGILRCVAADYRTGVIVGNLKAERDTKRLRALAQVVVDVQSAELEPRQVIRALSHIDVNRLDLLVIESTGGMAVAAPVDYGEEARVAVFSVSGGDDKAAEFPHRVIAADLVVLNKIDLLPHVAFDRAVFRADVRRINPAVPILEVSAAPASGLDQFERWLRASVQQHERVVRSADEFLTPPESFLG